jgi:hypothetical protein
MLFGGAKMMRLSCDEYAEQIVAGERGVAPFSTYFIRLGLLAAARAT